MRLLLVFLVLILVLPVAAQDDVVPRFEPVECPFATDVGSPIECGFVVVPEQHADPDGATIRLSVVVVRAEDPEPDPVMILSGGPGEKTTQNGAASLLLFSSLVENRDMIIFDQRGVGLSEPALECPEWVDAQFQLLREVPDPERSTEVNYETLVACSQRLTDEGFNLAAYNSVENAADVRAIATALGYEQVNLVGISYGSLLAQHVIREQPDVVRAAIIDSVLPLSASLSIDTVDTTYNALNRLFDACAADEACNTAYPDLEQVLFDVVDELNANPVPATLTNPLTGETYDGWLTGDGTVNVIIVMLYQTTVIPSLPQAIYDMHEGNYDLISQLNSLFLAALDALSRGMQYSVMCSEDLIGRQPEELLERIMTIPPQLRGVVDVEIAMEYSIFNICANWNVEALDASIKEPLATDIPMLLFGGEFDPVTPFIYAEQVAQTLPNAHAYEIPSTGHSVLVASECAREIANQFLDVPDAEPDASCIDAIPDVQFVVPGGEALALVPFTSEMFGISGVIPEGWQEISPGTYAESALSQIALLQQALPGDIETVTGLLGQQLGLETFPDPVGTREANGLVWNLYDVQIQGATAALAVTEADGMGYLIMLIVGLGDQEHYYDTLFLPAIDALTPAE